MGPDAARPCWVTQRRVFYGLAGRMHAHSVAFAQASEYVGNTGNFKRSVGRLADKFDGIDPSAVLQHFKMQIRTRSTSGFTHECDRLALSDLFANVDEIL